MLSLEKLRIALAGVSITYPLESAIPPAKRKKQQVIPPQETTQKTLPMDSFPNAPTFDGVDDKLDMPYSPELNPSSFTVEMWVMVQGGSGYQSILASVAGSPLDGRKGYLLCITPARQWQFWLGTGQPKAFWQVINGTQAKLATWTHLAGTYDRNSQTMALFINGREVGRETGIQYQPNDGNPTRVGAGVTEHRGASPCFFQGKIAEVHVWDRVLTTPEIQTLAAQQSIEVQAEPVQENMGEWGQTFEQNQPPTGNFYPPTENTTTSNFTEQQGQEINPSLPLQPNVEQPLTKLPIKETPLTFEQPNPTMGAMADPETVIWQIGSPGQGGTPVPTGPWTIEYNYIVGADADPLNHPTIPCCLVPPNANTIPNSTSQLNIHFGLLEDYTDGELLLCYNRYGSGEDNIFLDGQLIAKTPGADKGKLKQSQFSLPSIKLGPHTISITTSNNADAAHLLDYLQLQIHQSMVSNHTSQFGELTGNSSQSPDNQSNSPQSSGPTTDSELISPVTSVAAQVTQGIGNQGYLGQANGMVDRVTSQDSTNQNSGEAGMLGGLLNQVGGVAGGLPVAGGLVGGLTGQGDQSQGDRGQGSDSGLAGGLLNQVGGIAGGLPVAGGLVGGLTGQGGVAGGLLNQVSGVAGGLPVAGGLVSGLTGQGAQGNGLGGGLLNQVGGLTECLPVAGGLVGGLTGQGGQGGLGGGLLNQLGGVAGGLPGAGGLVGGLTGQGGQGGVSAEVTVQLAALVQQLTLLVAQLTQIIGQLGIANQTNAGLGGAGQMVGQQQQALGGDVSLPGLTSAQVSQLSAMTGLSAAQLSQLSTLAGIQPAQILQIPSLTGGLSPAQVLAQLQNQRR